MEKISGVYKITNTITGDFYIGSSKDVKRRWAEHEKPSAWKRCPNNPMYLDMKKYGVDSFEFQVITEVEPALLKKAEQQFIEKLQPTYNSNNAKGLDIEKYNEYQKEYHIEYYQQNHKKRNEYQKEYNNQLCSYNGETITLDTLRARFRRAEIEHPTIEAKKYLIKKESNNAIEFYDIYP